MALLLSSPLRLNSRIGSSSAEAAPTETLVSSRSLASVEAWGHGSMQPHIVELLQGLRIVHGQLQQELLLLLLLLMIQLLQLEGAHRALHAHAAQITQCLQSMSFGGVCSNAKILFSSITSGSTTHFLTADLPEA